MFLDKSVAPARTYHHLLYNNKGPVSEDLHCSNCEQLQ